MQKLENVLLKSMVPMIKTTETLLKSREKAEPICTDGAKGLLQLILDAMTIVGHATEEVNAIRRDLIKHDLNEQYSQLCGSQILVTNMLFGDDLSKSIKGISETNKVGQKVSSQHQPKGKNTYHSHRKASHAHYSKKPFLFKGQRDKNRYKIKPTSVKQ